MDQTNIDYELLKLIQDSRLTQLDPLFQWVSKFTTLLTIGILLISILFLVLQKKDKIAPKSILLIVTFLFNALIVFILKFTIQRPRPFITHEDIIQLSSGGSPSLPSGHTAEVFAVTTIIWFLFKNKSVFIVMLIWSLTVAYSRMALGVHYPMDILTGSAIGCFNAFLCFKLYQKFTQKN